MAKPSEKFTWATDPGATVLAPLVGEQAAGFAIGPGNKPRASWMNYLFRTIGQWLAWLDGLTGEAITWTNLHTFDGGIYVGAGDVEVAGIVTAGAIVTPDTVEAKNTAKAWMFGSQLHASYPTGIAKGVGFASALAINTNTIRFAFYAPMPSVLYATLVNGDFGGRGYPAVVVSRQTTHFDVRFTDDTGVPMTELNTTASMWLSALVFDF